MGLALPCSQTGNVQRIQETEFSGGKRWVGQGVPGAAWALLFPLNYSLTGYSCTHHTALVMGAGTQSPLHGFSNPAEMG